MLRKSLLLIFSVLSLTAFILFLPSHVNAQNLDLKTCAAATNWNNYVSDCKAHLNTHVIPCLQGGYQGKTLPASTWEAGASWGSANDEKCIDTNGDGKLDKDELAVCKKNFSNYMCRNMPYTGIFGSCTGDCLGDIPMDTSGKRMWEVLGAEFERQYNNQHAITPTPTPTLAPTPPVGTVDDPLNCIARLGSPAVTTSCKDGLNILTACMSIDDPGKINKDHAFWQGAAKDYKGAENQINNAINANTEINKAGQCVDTKDYEDFITKFQSAVSFVQGNIVTNPDPTPAEEGGWLFSDSTIETPVFGVDCGISDSPDINKQRCCVAVRGQVSLNSPTPLNVIDPVMEALANGVIGIFRKAAQGIHATVNALILDSDPTQNAYCLKGVPSSNKVSKSPYDDPNCLCEPEKRDTIDPDICKGLPAAEQTPCAQCLQGISIVDGKEVLGNAGIWTGIGCIQTNLTDFIEKNVFGPLLGLAGVVSLGCIIYSAFIMQTSSGSPEQIQKAQELITSCIMGLIMIILSVFVLRVIGVDILRIPGFGG